MNRLLSLLCVIFLSAVTMVGCTPKPDSPEPIMEDFLAAWQSQNFDEAGSLTDSASDVSTVLKQSWDGLQTESVTATLTGVDLNGTVATAHYAVTWKLPKDRELSYSTTATLNNINDNWIIRWQPTALYPRLGANQHLELRAIEAERARVVSSDGADILVPGFKYRVLVENNPREDRTQIAEQLAAIINPVLSEEANEIALNPQKLAKDLGDAKGNFSVTMLSAQQKDAVEKQLTTLPGVRLNEEKAMVPTDPNFAPDIVSRVEPVIADQLEGTPGWQIAAVTGDGALIETLESQAPEVAPSVKISLDHNVQRAAEEAVSLRQDKQTMLVAIRPSTGEILAVAQTGLADEDGDLALTGQFPPGSTFKIITANAGIQKKGLQPDNIVPCPGSMDIYGRIVTNYNGFSLGDVPLREAFAQSCNTTFADISTQLQPGQLKKIGQEFGLGVDYTIPGLNTMTGQIPEGKTELERTESGYGQGLDLASPFGMAMVSATAAAGKTPVPTLLSGTETTQNITPEAPPAASIEKLRELMSAVVSEGTAGGMQAKGTIYGKTGEAEINGGSHAWFTGYRDDLAFATLVVLGGGSETSVAVTDKFLVRLDELNSAAHPQ